MTPEETIEILEEVKELDNTLYAYSSAYMEALEVAISALKEGQQYHKIGTVEECREAVEKQKPKNPVKDKYHHNCCPNCGWIVSGEGGYGEEFCPHCENCGQAIQWENLEGVKMKIHKLKLNAKYYEDSERGIKTFEIRKNDRDYKIGDVLELREYIEDMRGLGYYTGNVHWKIITYILDDDLYLAPGYVCLGLSPIAEPEQEDAE